VSEETAESTPPRETPCLVCREPIRIGAKKCIHCDSFLDWRRWLGISQTTLALLVALVSVVAASGPRVAQLLSRDVSELTLNIRQVFGQRLELAASNHGNRNAQLLSAHLIATRRDKTQIGPIQLEIAGSHVVGAGQDTLSGLSIPPALIPTFLGWPHKDIQSAKMVLRVNEFRKSPEDRTVDVPLAQFQLLCRATEDLDIISRRGPQAVLEDRRLTSRCN